MAGRAVVLGGGGHFGAAVTRALEARGWQVAAVTRRGGPRANLAETAAERLAGDDADPAALARWLAGASLVIDAAAPYPLTLRDLARPDARPAAEAAARMDALLAATARTGAALLHVGSFATLDDGRSVRMRAIRASHPYFRVKAVMEARALAAARAGAPVLVLNPTALIGPWDLKPPAQCFTASVLTGALRAAVPDIVNVIDVRDAAETGLRAFEAGAFGARVPIAGHDVPVGALARLIAAEGGVAPPPETPGLALGAVALWGGEAAAAAFGRAPVWPSLPALLTLAGGPAAPGALQRAFGPAPRPLVESVRDAVAWRLGPGRAAWPAHAAARTG